jgi:hypothetical protein
VPGVRPGDAPNTTLSAFDMRADPRKSSHGGHDRSPGQPLRPRALACSVATRRRQDSSY